MGNFVFDADWMLLLPEITLLALAILLLIADFMMGTRGQRRILGVLSLGAVLVTCAVVVARFSATGTIGHTFVADPFANLFKLIILAGTALVLLMAIHYLDKHKDIYQGEFYYLILFAAAGAMLMVSSLDLITLFIGLEIISIASYCLVGFHRQSVKSSEAAMKYVVLGGVATAMTLYGMSFLYGLTGATSIVVIGQALPALYAAFPALVIMAFLFMLAGFAFKISLVPFHMWAADVYEGAPTPITAFLAVVSKIAALVLFIRLLTVMFGGIYGAWYFYIAILAVFTMVIGNLVALQQTNIKRLMAWSGIAHAGYMIVPIAAALAWEITLSQISFYAVAYLLMTLGAFAVVTQVSKQDKITDFAGLSKRSPWLAFAMTVFLISLAGLPVTAGFIGKFYIFFGVMTNGMYWLAAAMAGASIVSFYYYFAIIKQMYMRESDEESLVVAPAINIVVVVTLVGTLVLGFMPSLLMDVLTQLRWMSF